MGQQSCCPICVEIRWVRIAHEEKIIGVRDDTQRIDNGCAQLRAERKNDVRGQNSSKKFIK